jgi:hypothetical protein
LLLAAEVNPCVFYDVFFNSFVCKQSPVQLFYALKVQKFLLRPVKVSFVSSALLDEVCPCILEETELKSIIFSVELLSFARKSKEQN